MPIKQAPEIVLSEKQRAILEKMSKGTHTPWHWIQRSTILLMAASGISNKAIARETGWNRNTVKLWRIRFAASATELNDIEKNKLHTLKAKIESVLSDEPRSGAPSKFTDEQVAQILALACQSPEELGLPFSHWTPGALARVAVSRGIVPSISTRQVGRFLKRYGSKASPMPVLAPSQDRRSKAI